MDGLPFDGWQRVDTGYCPVAGDRFECEVTVAGDQPRSTAAVFGTVPEQKPERTFAFYVRQNGDESSVVAYGDTARGGFFPRNKRVTLSVGPDGAAWTGEGGASRLELMPGFAMDGVTPLMIGDVNVSGREGQSSPAGTGAAMTLHRFRVWRGGHTLIHDYEPEQNGLRDRCCDDRFLKIDPESGVEKVKVSVKNGIPNVQSVAVHDPSGRLTGKQVGNFTEYTVKKWDDISVYYTLEPDYVSQTKNPIVYGKISGNKTIDGDTINAQTKYVTVTVENAIPHVTNVVVTSRQTGKIAGTVVDSNTVYKVERWNDISVGYEVEPNYVSLAKNPISFPNISADARIDGTTIKTVRRLTENIPYRTWDAQKSAMVDCVCSNAIPVTADTVTLKDGQWYAVTGTVSTANLKVDGAAHLILCDGAKMTATGGGDDAGVAVEAGNSLAIYGQSAGTGELVAKATEQGGHRGAGIGGASRRPGGTVTINGGRVTATGGWDGAGIGGGCYAASGAVTINGGRIRATGGGAGPGIGSGYQATGAGGTLVINGGTVMAKWAPNAAGPDGKYHGDDIGRGFEASDASSVNVTIKGGSVSAGKIENAPSNGVERVYCVTAKWSKEGGAGRLAVEGLGEYGTNDIYSVDGSVYLWLPDGAHRFTVSDGATTNRYCAVVHGRGVTVEPLGPIGFFVNGEDIGDTGSGTGWNYNKNMKNLTLSEVGLYVLSGVAMNDEVHIHVAGEKAAGATVILSNAVVFVSGQPPALNVDQNISLLMAGGSSFLGATNNVMAISVGPKAALTVGLAPGADETEAIIGVFNYGDVAAIGGAGSVTVRGGTLAVWADNRAAETPINRTADVFCMLAGNDPETAKVVDTYNGEPYVLVTAAIAPVTPGKPFGSFTTAEAATNVMKKAVLAPRDDVEAALGSGAARQTYCNMFGFAVTGGDESWFVEALLTPEARTNLAETATGATRQIPVAAIARLPDASAIAQLPEDVTTNVTVNGCAPGFFYSLYDGWALTNIVADANATNLNVLCGADAKVTFPEVKKPSDAAGFFKVGVGVTDNVGK